jgi:hypothetical protein
MEWRNFPKFADPDQLKKLGLPYVNDFMVSPFDSVKLAQEQCPFGYRVVCSFWGTEDVPDNAIKIGKTKVRTGDRESVLFAVPISMVEARRQLASEYQTAIDRLEQIRTMIEGKQRIRTAQIRAILGS